MMINEIKDKKLRTLAIIRTYEELKDTYSTDYKYLIIKIVNYICYDNSLVDAFDWANTSEGYEFWYLVNDKRITKYSQKFMNYDSFSS